MDLQNSFTVPADVETAWQTLLDVEAIAPCMPGASLESVDGDHFTGNVKVKLGPVTMVYAGQAHFVSKDPAQHAAVIEGTGKETRGTGTAKATVTLALIPQEPNRTRVDVSTHLTITGKAAQFGRGVMQDVASRLVTQFAANLEQILSSPSQSEQPAEESPPGVRTPSPPPGSTPAAAALDLGSVAMAPVLKRVIPVVAVVAAIVAGAIWIGLSR